MRPTSATGDTGRSRACLESVSDAVQGEIGQHAGGVTGLAFPTNNQQLISTGGDGVIRFWQLPVRRVACWLVSQHMTDIAIPESADRCCQRRRWDVAVVRCQQRDGLASSGLDGPITSVAVQPE